MALTSSTDHFINGEKLTVQD